MCATFKMHQGAGIILVGHVSHRAIAAADIVMGAAARLRNGTSPEKDFFVASDSRYWPGQHVGHINYVRHQVAQGAQPVFLLKAPGEEAVGVSRIAVEKA